MNYLYPKGDIKCSAERRRMARFPVTICKERLSQYMEAEAVVLTGQSYSIGGRSFTRANLADIRRGVEYWSEKLSEAEKAEATGRSGIFMRRAIPHG